MGPALQGIFVGQGPRALPGVRGKTGRRGEGTPPYGARGKECLRGSRADRGVRPYGCVARSACGGTMWASAPTDGNKECLQDWAAGHMGPALQAQILYLFMCKTNKKYRSL